MNYRFNLNIPVSVGLCVLSMLFGPGARAQTTLAPDSFEPNNEQSQAASIGVQGMLSLNVPVVISANFHGSDDQGDWYVTRPTTSGLSIATRTRLLAVDLTGPSSDHAFELTLLAKYDLPLASYHVVGTIPGSNPAERIYLLDFRCGNLFDEGCDMTLLLQVRQAVGNTANEPYELKVTLLPVTVLEPAITSMAPTSGSVETTVTFTGARFTGTTAVRFNGVPATFTVSADNSISAIVPAGATTGYVTMTNAVGSALSGSSFTVTAASPPPSGTAGTSGRLPGLQTKNATSKNDPAAQVPPRSSGGASVPTVASKAGPRNIPGVVTPTIYEAEPCCGIVANPELKGRLGRIVVAYPANADFKSAGPRTDIHKAGDAKRLRTDYGNFAVEMTPGTYDLNISGQAVAGVVVEPRSDTVVKVGVLRLNGTGNTRFDLFPGGGKKALQTLYGQSAVGLPPGTYEVEVNGQRELVTIGAGRITEY